MCLCLSCYVGAPIDLESDQSAQPIEIETIEIPTDDIENGLSIDSTEREIIKKALMTAQGNCKAAAAKLGISERTLYRKMKEYGL